MTHFVLHAKAPNGEDVRLIYDNETNELTDARGQSLLPLPKKQEVKAAAVPFSKDAPAGKKSPRILKIQMGLSCNYSCEYCSQRFVPHADETTKRDVEPFLDQLDSWLTTVPERIEFWGGEPFVYWKTFKPLAEGLRKRFPDKEATRFQVITNGSLLDDEKLDWLDDLGFQLAISHDAVGQHVRGPDPLEDPKTREVLLKAYRRFAPDGRLSFNSMLNSKNDSRAAIQKFFQELLGDQDVSLGEGLFIDPYDEGGLQSSFIDDPGSMALYSRKAFGEIRTGQASCFGSVKQKIMGFIHDLHHRTPASTVQQKCGMDSPDRLAVDLRGNVMTCQNVSAVSTAPNGESHKIGHVSDLGSVKLRTSTHWANRDGCPKCPVLHLCRGNCMFLEGKLWEAGCNNSYADNIVFFAAAIEALTGLVVYYIEGDLPENRKDIFGFVHQPAPKKKVIPIKAV